VNDDIMSAQTKAPTKEVCFDRFVPQSFYAPRGHKGVARATPSSREMIFQGIGDQLAAAGTRRMRASRCRPVKVRLILRARDVDRKMALSSLPPYTDREPLAHQNLLRNREGWDTYSDQRLLVEARSDGFHRAGSFK